jgi:hypothetical protein
MECIPSLAEMCAVVRLIGTSLIIGKLPLSEYNKVNIFPFSVLVSPIMFAFSLFGYRRSIID